MQDFNKNEISECFNKKGKHETLKYIFKSRKVPFLDPSVDILKILELTSLPKGERSIVKYLNHVEDKNRSNGSLYGSLKKEENIGNTYIVTNEQKMSDRQIKNMKTKTKTLTPSRLQYLKSFIGITELDRDGVQSKAVPNKLNKIKALYIAQIPRGLTDLDPILKALEKAKVKVSKQDLISFYAIITINFHKSLYVYIPASVWNAFFGKRKVKIVKELFDKLNVLKFVRCAIPGFSAELYCCVFQNKILDTFEMVKISITSIKSLEKINRIKVYESKFSFDNRLKALITLSKLYFESKMKKGSRNLTSVFLLSGEFQPLIDDLKFMSSNIYYDELHEKAVVLGAHLTRYITYNNSGQYKRYIPFIQKGGKFIVT